MCGEICEQGILISVPVLLCGCKQQLLVWTSVLVFLYRLGTRYLLQSRSLLINYAVLVLSDFFALVILFSVGEKGWPSNIWSYLVKRGLVLRFRYVRGSCFDLLWWR